MIFDNWTGLIRVLVLAPLAYAALVLLLRVSGKRTLAKLNAFDLVVTVALGSTLATITLTGNVALVEGVLGLILLIGLQYLIATASVRWRSVERWVKAEPRLLLIDGTFDDRAMREERITRDELLASVRSSGLGDLSLVAAVVLETDGSLSVVSRDRAGSRNALPGNQRHPQ